MHAGEVITEAESIGRMRTAASAGEHAFYVMNLDAGLVIDARYKGNISRLINSSCAPNCEAQKWTDMATGEPRIGLFALHPIAYGEELTYDYKFQHLGLANAARAYRYGLLSTSVSMSAPANCNPDCDRCLHQTFTPFDDKLHHIKPWQLCMYDLMKPTRAPVHGQA